MITYIIKEAKSIKKVPKTRDRTFNAATFTKMQPVLIHLATTPSTLKQLNLLFPNFTVYNLRYLMSRFIKDKRIQISGQKNANGNKACVYSLPPQYAALYSKKEC